MFREAQAALITSLRFGDDDYEDSEDDKGSFVATQRQATVEKIAERIDELDLAGDPEIPDLLSILLGTLEGNSQPFEKALAGLKDLLKRKSEEPSAVMALLRSRLTGDLADLFTGQHRGKHAVLLGTAQDAAAQDAAN